MWVAKVVALVRLSVDMNGATDDNEFALVRFMELVPPADNVDKKLGCVVLRWATDEDEDPRESCLSVAYTTVNRKISTDRVAPWYGLVPVSTILGTVQVVRDRVPCQPFFHKTHWKNHRFYINRFLKLETKTRE